MNKPAPEKQIKEKQPPKSGNNNEHGFTIGEHSEDGFLYKFRLSNKKYSILRIKDEETETLLNTTNQQKAYDEWNAIKRTEKARKSM